MHYDLDQDKLSEKYHQKEETRNPKGPNPSFLQFVVVVAAVVAAAAAAVVFSMVFLPSQKPGMP